MRYNAIKRIGAVLFAVFLVLGSVPVHALADVQDDPVIITAFAELSPQVREQAVALGTSVTDLDLPRSLVATVYDGSTYRERAVPVTKWQAEPRYDGDVAGEYVFTPHLDEEAWLLSLGQSTQLPRIWVFVSIEQNGTAFRQIQVELEEVSLKNAAVLSDNILSEGEKLENIYARELWGILSKISHSDEEIQYIDFAETDRPAKNLALGGSFSLGYSPDELDGVLDELSVEIRDQIAQPASEAFWMDYPDRHWLDEEMLLQMDYTVEGSVLYVDRVGFGFGFLDIGDNDVEVIYNGIVVYGADDTVGSSTAITAAINYINTDLSDTTPDNTILKINKSGLLWPANTPVNSCSVIGGEDPGNIGQKIQLRMQLYPDNNTNGSAIFNGKAVFEHFIIVNNNSNGYFYIRADDLIFRGISTSFNRMCIRLIGTGDLTVEDSADIILIENYDNVFIKGDVSLYYYIDCSTLYLSGVLEIMVRFSSGPALRIDKLIGADNPDDAVIHFSNYVNNGLLQYINFKQDLPDIFEKKITLTSDVAYSAGNKIIQVAGDDPLNGYLDNIVLGDGFDDRFTLKYYDNAGDRHYMLYLAYVRLSYYTNTDQYREYEYPTFAKAVDEANGLPSNYYGITISLRDDIEHGKKVENDDGTFIEDTSAFPGVPATITSEERMSTTFGGPFALIDSDEDDGFTGKTNQGFTLYADTTLVDVILRSESPQGGTPIPSLMIDEYTLTIKNDVTLDTITLYGDLTGEAKSTVIVDGNVEVNVISDVGALQVNVNGLDVNNGVTAGEITVGPTAKMETGSAIDAKTIEVKTSGAIDTGGDVDAQSVTLDASATVDVTGGVAATDAIGVAAGAELKASGQVTAVNSIAVDGAKAVIEAQNVETASLSLTGGGDVKVSGYVKTQAMPDTAGSVSFTGTAVTNPGGILDLENAGSVTLNGELTIKAESLNPLASGIKFIRMDKNATISDAEAIRLSSNLEEYVLELEKGTGFDYYVLMQVVVSVTPSGMDIRKFTSFAKAVNYMDDIKTAGSANDAIVQLWANIDENFPAMPTLPFTMGSAGGSGNFSFQKNSGSDIELKSDAIFDSVDVVLNNNGTISAGNHSLTFSANSHLVGTGITIHGTSQAAGAEFKTGAGVVLDLGNLYDFNVVNLGGGTELEASEIYNVNTLTFGAGADVTLSEIHDIGSIDIGNSVTIDMNRLHSYNTISMGSGVEFGILSQEGEGNFELPQTMSYADFAALQFTVDKAGSYSPQPGHKLIRGDIHGQTLEFKFTLGGGYEELTVRKFSNGSQAYDYYVLSASVEEVRIYAEIDGGGQAELSYVATTPTAMVYGDSLDLEFSLHAGSKFSSAEITDRVGETISISVDGKPYDLVIGDTGRASLDVKQRIDSNWVGDTVTGSYSGTRNIVATYDDPMVQAPAVTRTGYLQVARRPLSVAFDGDVIPSKVYDGNDAAVYADGLVFVDPQGSDKLRSFENEQGIDEQDAVTITTASVSFNNALVENTKTLVVSDIILGGAQGANYMPVPEDTTTGYLQGLPTTARITPKPLTLQGTVTKEYDGNLTITSTLTLNGVIDNDDVSYSLNLQYQNANAGDSIPLVGTNPQLTEADAGNYILDSWPTTGTITRKTIYVDNTLGAGHPKATKVYDGSPDVGASWLTSAAQYADITGAVPGESPVVEAVSAVYDSSNATSGSAGAAASSVTYTFQLTDAPVNQNYILDSGSNIAVGDGSITKAIVSVDDPITVEVKYNEPETDSVDLMGFVYSFIDPAGYISGMVPGDQTFSIGPVTDTYSLFVVGYPSISGTDLLYQTRIVQTTAIDQSATVDLTIESQNYQGQSGNPIDASIVFDITGRTKLTITGFSVDSKVYDNAYIEPDFSNLTFNDGNANIENVAYTYYYLDRNNNNDRLPSPPKDVGSYTLVVKVVDDDDDYRGSASASFEITPRPLTFYPKNKEITLGDPVPTWSWPDDFEAVPTGTDINLAPGEELDDLGITPTPTVETSGLDPADKGSAQNVPVTLQTYQDSLGNYTISTRDGTFLVKGKEIGAGEQKLMFSPDAPDGERGWYVSPIRVWSEDNSTTGAKFEYINLHGNDPFGNDVLLNTQGGDTVAFYVATAPTGGLVSEPSELFSYLLDSVLPDILDVSYQQIKDTLTVTLTAEVYDADSGIYTVTAKRLSDGEEYAMAYDGPGRSASPNGSYSCVVEAGTYEITVEDVAGNTYTHTQPVEVKVSNVFGIEVYRDSTPVTRVAMKLDDAPVDLVAQVVAGDAVPGEHFDFEWDVNHVASVTASGTGDAQAVLSPVRLGRSTMLVHALAETKEVEVVVYDSTTPIDPPPDVDYNLELWVVPLEDDRTVVLRQDMLDTTNHAIKEFLTDDNWPYQTEYWRLMLVRDDTYAEVTDYPLGQTVQISVPLPAGSDIDEDAFLLIFKRTGLSTPDFTIADGKLTFSIDSLGEFAVTYKGDDGGTDNPDPGPGPGPGPGPDPGDNGNNGNNGNGNGGGGSSIGGTGSGSGSGSGSGKRRDDSDYWNAVRDIINKTEDGGVVEIWPPISITRCPTYVLQALKDRDVTLIIHWEGGTIYINGLNLLPFDNVIYYTLAELMELYGALLDNTTGVVELHNPTTGGDDGIVVRNPRGVVQAYYQAGQLTEGAGQTRNQVVAAAQPESLMVSRQLGDDSLDSGLNKSFMMISLAGLLTVFMMIWWLARKDGREEPAAQLQYGGADRKLAVGTVTREPLVTTGPAVDWNDVDDDMAQEDAEPELRQNANQAGFTIEQAATVAEKKAAVPEKRREAVMPVIILALEEVIEVEELPEDTSKSRLQAKAEPAEEEYSVPAAVSPETVPAPDLDVESFDIREEWEAGRAAQAARLEGVLDAVEENILVAAEMQIAAAQAEDFVSEVDYMLEVTEYGGIQDAISGPDAILQERASVMPTADVDLPDSIEGELQSDHQDSEISQQPTNIVNEGAGKSVAAGAVAEAEPVSPRPVPAKPAVVQEYNIVLEEPEPEVEYVIQEKAGDIVPEQPHPVPQKTPVAGISNQKAAVSRRGTKNPSDETGTDVVGQEKVSLQKGAQGHEKQGVNQFGQGRYMDFSEFLGLTREKERKNDVRQAKNTVAAGIKAAKVPEIHGASEPKPRVVKVSVAVKNQKSPNNERVSMPVSRMDAAKFPPVQDKPKTADERFFAIVEEHKRLRERLAQGLISRGEYERQSRVLMVRL